MPFFPLVGPVHPETTTTPPSVASSAGLPHRLGVCCVRRVGQRVRLVFALGASATRRALAPVTTLIVPPMDEEPWPTLGPAVVARIEEALTFGPGDLLGEPYRLNDEQKALVYRLYEVHPKCKCWGTRMCLEDHKRRPGRRRFKRGGISLRKGLMKTELMAAIAFVELDPEGPVRCVNWVKRRGGEWEPEGGPVTDPYIPLLATSEEQVERLAFGAMYEMVSRGRAAREFDIGLERIMRYGGDGVCEPVSSAPNQRDGARTTFQGFDETHRLRLPNQKAAVTTMLNNIPKRPLADPWTLETTTSYSPGEGSVAEDTMELARGVAEGRLRNTQFFFFHREAGAEHDITTPAGLRAAVVDATGECAMEWTDVEGIEAIYNDPSSDKEYFERVWLNRATGLAGRAFDAKRWRALTAPLVRTIPKGRLVTLGFDGARFLDSTGLVATDVESGLQQVVGAWENPGRGAWETPLDEVQAAMEYAFEEWEVYRGFFDPYYWESEIAGWQGKWGEKVIVEFATNRWRLMALTFRAYHQAIARGEVVNDGSEVMFRHMGNAVRKYVNFVDESGERLWLVDKERADSPFKIDLVVAGALSWQARLDALSEGAQATGDVEYHIYTV